MREKIYYMLAISVLLVAIAALVVVFGQNQPTTSQPQAAVQQQQATNSMQTMFTALAARVNQNAQYAFRVRVVAGGTDNAISATTVTIGAGGSKLTDVGTDFFCISSGSTTKACVPFSQVLSVQVPT